MVVVVAFAAVVDVVGAVVEAVVDGVAVAAVVELVDPSEAEAVVVVAPMSDAATVVVVEEACWRAMPRPRALATPMLREATRARLRAAGCGRFVVMARTYGAAVSRWFAWGEPRVRSP